MKKKNKKLFGDPLLRHIVVFDIFAIIFLFSAFQLFMYWNDNRNSQKHNDKLIQQAVSVVTTDPNVTPANPTGSGEQGDQEDEEALRLSASIPITVDFDVLNQENPNIIAWIYCDGTPINYPVVQGQDNQYCLRRLPDGSSKPSGSLFADFRNDRSFGDLNTLIYGHNMSDDSMFGTLTDYKNPSYYEEHPQFWILTKEKAYLVDLIAGYVTGSDSDAYKLYENKTDLQAHLRTAMEESTFTPKDVDIDQVEQIVTLSTCSYEYSTARYVLVGSMTPVEYPKTTSTS